MCSLRAIDLIGPALILQWVACGRLAFEPLEGADAGQESDASPAPDGATAVCGPFALDPTPLPETYRTAFITRSGRGLWYSSEGRLWQGALGSDWEVGGAAEVQETDQPGDEEVGPTLTSDELHLVFYQTSVRRIYEMSRSSVGVAFESVTEPEFPPGGLWDPELSADGRTMIFAADWEDAGNLYRATRRDVSEGFAEPVPMTELNSPELDGAPSLSADGTTLVFASSRRGAIDLYVSERSTPGEDFPPPTPLDALSSPEANDDDPALSPDGETLIFGSDRSGEIRTYRATRTCE